MAQERIMAEPVDAAEQPKTPTIYLADKFGERGVHRTPEAPPDPLAEPTVFPDHDPRTGRPIRSLFQRMLYLSDHYETFPPGGLSATDQQRLTDKRGEYRDRVDGLVDRADGLGILGHIRGEALKFYKEVKLARREELERRADRKAVIESGRGQRYRETFWNRRGNSLRELVIMYEGVADYVWDLVVDAIDKEENPDSDITVTVRGKNELREIESLRQEKRQTDPKYFEEITPYGTFPRLAWVESDWDFVPATYDWARDTVNILSSKEAMSDAQAKNDSLGKTLEEGRRMRDVRLKELKADGKEITESGPYFRMSGALLEVIVGVIGYEALVYTGQEEAAAGYAERVGSNYVAHHDALRLVNKYEARIEYMLGKKGINSKSPTGQDWSTYWMGQPWDLEKPLGEGETTGDHRARIEHEVKDDALSHDFFIDVLSKEFLQIEKPFEYRFNQNQKGEDDPSKKKDLRYSFEDDIIEKLLIDPDDEIRDKIAAKIYDSTNPAQDAILRREALERHRIRVELYRNIQEKNNEREGLGLFATEEEVAALKKTGRGRLPQRIFFMRIESRKNALRTQLQQDLRDQGLSPTEVEAQADNIEKQMRILAKQKRQAGVRQRILKEMGKQVGSSLAAGQLVKIGQAMRNGDLDTRDKLLWEWVEKYNRLQIRRGEKRFFPSRWDRIRWDHEMSSKVIDRRMTDEQFEAMYELIPVSDEIDFDNVPSEVAQAWADVKFGFQLARANMVFNMEDVLLGGMRTRDKEPKTGEYRDEAYKLKRIFDIVQQDVEKDIAKEREELETVRDQLEKVEAELALAKSDNNRDLIRTKRAEREVKYQEWIRQTTNANHLLTHALREAGYVDGKLPVWSYNFIDPTTINVIALALADYGVDTARNHRIDHNDKRELYDIIDRGRRTLKARYDRAALDYMEGRYAVFEEDEDGNVVSVLAEGEGEGKEVAVIGQDGRITMRSGEKGQVLRDRNGIPYLKAVLGEGEEEGQEVAVIDQDGHIILVGGAKGVALIDEHDNPYRIPKPAESFFLSAEEFWDPDNPGIKKERLRIINKGGARPHRRSFDARFEWSTSGGLRVPELNYMFGDLGYYPQFIKAGVLNEIGWTGFMKREDEAAAKDHMIVDVLDPIYDPKERRATYTLSKYFTGGQIGEGQSTPGEGQEPYKASYKTADLFRKWWGSSGGGEQILQNRKMGVTLRYVNLMQKWRAGFEPLTEEEKAEMEEKREFSYLDFDNLFKDEADEFFDTIAGGTTYLRDFFQAEQPVEETRAGILFRTVAYDNWIKFNTFREKVREANAKGDRGFLERLGYSPEIGSELALRMMDIVMADDFKILRPYERVKYAQMGALMKAQGFEKRLKISGLDLFMRVEGFQEVDTNGKPTGRRVMGEKTPPRVRRKLADERNTKAGQKIWFVDEAELEAYNS